MASAAAKINPLLLSFSTLFFVSVLLTFPVAAISDNPCAYPCYPPPTGTGSTTTPVTTSPPSTQTGSYPPPPAVYNNPTPTGYYPYNPPPSTYGYGGANPPPDPILPYFPFYYKNGARGDKHASSATPLITRSSTLFNTIASTNLLIVFVYFFFL